MSEKIVVIDAAVSEGRLTVEQAGTLLKALRDAAEIADIENTSAVLALVKRGRSLTEAIEMIDAHGPSIADDQPAKVLRIVPARGMNSLASERDFT